MVYLITYDLHRMKNYQLLHERIQELGSSIRPLESFWLVDTSKDLNQLYDYIKASVDDDDTFYITAISNSGVGVINNANDWSWINSKFPNLPLPPFGRGISPSRDLGKLDLKPLESIRLGKIPAKPLQKPLDLDSGKLPRLGKFPLKPR